MNLPFMKHRISLLFWLGLFSAFIVTRLCHCDLLWSDEDYHIAAAIQTLHSKIPYQDFFYDKPVLNLLFYFLIDGTTGCVLRIAGALYCLILCLFTFHFTSRIWNYREGYLAASLLAFFLIFYFPGANIPLQPDTLMILPHLIAVYFAWFRRPLAAGITAGLAFLFNAKGLFVLAACVLFCARGLPLMLLGFSLPNIFFLGWL